MSTVVRELIRRYEKLSEREQTQFESHFHKLRERRWNAALRDARRIGKTKGVTEEMIMDAIYDMRYGKGQKRR